MMTITDEENRDSSVWRLTVNESHAGATTQIDSSPRLEQQQELHSALRARRSVIVVGDAGIGKTQLVTRTLDQLSQSDPQITVRPIYADDTDANLLELIGLPSTTDPQIIAAQLTQWLTPDDHSAAEDNRPSIVRIEDAHLLDAASSRALTHLIQSDAITVVATMRSAAARHKPWVTLWRNGCVTRLDVQPFSRREIEAYLQAALRGPITSDSAWRLWRHTGGNPYHVAELVRDQISHRAFFEIDGVWMWDGNPGPDPRLHDIVTDDMDQISAEARTLVEILAFLGPMPSHLLYDLATDTEISALDRRGLLSTQTVQTPGGGRDQATGLMHDLYANAVRLRVSRRRRGEILQRVIVEITSIEDYPALRSRFVELAVECGYAIDPELVLITMQTLLAEHKPRTLIHLATAAAPTMTTPQHMVTLLILRAEAWRQADSPDHAKRDLDEAATFLCALDNSAQTMDERSQTTIAWLVLGHARVTATIVQYHYDRADEAISYLESRRDFLIEQFDPAMIEQPLGAFEAIILAHRGYAGQHEQVTDLGATLLTTSTVSPEHLVPLAGPTAFGLAEQGDLPRALDTTRRYLGIAYAHLDKYPWGPAELVATHSMLLFWIGDVEPLITPHPMISTDRDPALLDRVSDHLGRGLVASIQGAWSTAVAEFHAANARFAHADMSGMGAYALHGEALAAAASGAAPDAWALLERAKAAPLRTLKVIESELALMRIDTLCWLRDKSAGAKAHELAIQARERGFARTELEALHRFVVRSTPTATDQARGAEPSSQVIEAVERLQVLKGIVHGRRPSLLIEHANAIVNNDADLAAIHERDLARCGLWLAPINDPVELTRREREIAALAAGGMSSKAIAQRLVVSVRTVDSHLSRVFTKTGVHSREELARIIR